MKKIKILSFGIIAYIIFLSLGCGSGGGGGSKSPIPKFNYTQDGYPIVAGEYTLVAGKTSSDCDFPSMTIGALDNEIVTQNGSQIYTTSTGPNLMPSDVSILEEDIPSGVIMKNGDFMVTASGKFLDEDGDIWNVNGALDGTFTPTGLSGIMSITMWVVEDSFSCTVTAPFEGDKL